MGARVCCAPGSPGVEKSHYSAEAQWHTRPAHNQQIAARREREHLGAVLALVRSTRPPATPVGSRAPAPECRAASGAAPEKHVQRLT